MAVVGRVLGDDQFIAGRVLGRNTPVGDRLWRHEGVLAGEPEAGAAVTFLVPGGGEEADQLPGLVRVFGVLDDGDEVGLHVGAGALHCGQDGGADAAFDPPTPGEGPGAVDLKGDLFGFEELGAAHAEGLERLGAGHYAVGEAEVGDVLQRLNRFGAVEDDFLGLSVDPV
ncbi:MAG: hypothetical protein OXF86_04440 [Caldilineaceae bacterium]|nr:hypothetical protein [Caldilineaceae bacterium]